MQIKATYKDWLSYIKEFKEYLSTTLGISTSREVSYFGPEDIHEVGADSKYSFTISLGLEAYGMKEVVVEICPFLKGDKIHITVQDFTNMESNGTYLDKSQFESGGPVELLNTILRLISRLYDFEECIEELYEEAFSEDVDFDILCTIYDNIFRQKNPTRLKMCAAAVSSLLLIFKSEPGNCILRWHELLIRVMFEEKNRDIKLLKFLQEFFKERFKETEL